MPILEELIACGAPPSDTVAWEATALTDYYIRLAHPVRDLFGEFQFQVIGPECCLNVSDCNGNGVPEECECVADVNGDGFVDQQDIIQIAEAFGPCPIDDPCPEDTDGDGDVDFDDLIPAWRDQGKCPFPNPLDLE